MRRITASEEYIQVAEVFVQYLIEYFGNREVNIFLNDVVRHVKRGQAYLNLQTSLSKIFQAVLNTKFSLQATLSMDSLLPLLDLIVDKQLKRIICKSVLQSCFT